VPPSRSETPLCPHCPGTHHATRVSPEDPSTLLPQPDNPLTPSPHPPLRPLVMKALSSPIPRRWWSRSRSRHRPGSAPPSDGCVGASPKGRRMKEAERGAVDQDLVQDSAADFARHRGAGDGRPPPSRFKIHKEPPKEPRYVEDQSPSPTPTPRSAPPPT
jgi:hypothetical protein